MSNRGRTRRNAACLSRRFLALLALALVFSLSSERAGAATRDPDPDPSVAGPSIPTIKGVTPTTDVVRGTPIRVDGDLFPLDASSISVSLGGFDVGHPVQVARKYFVFVVPQEAAREHGGRQPFPIGRWLMRVTFKIDDTRSYGGVTAVPFDAGFVNVVSDARSPLEVSAIVPLLVTPDTRRIGLIGDGMGGDAADYTLLVDGMDASQCASPPCKAPRLRFVSPHEIQIERPFATDERHEWIGKHTLSLRNGDVSTQGIEVTFVQYSPGWITFLSGVASALLLLAIGGLALWGGGKHNVDMPGAPSRAVYALLMDPQTDTYSLSKLQFYAWSAAALVGYSYLVLSRTLIQGHLDIVDVPENLPGILAVSAGTSVTSMAITLGRGSKAAGKPGPSFQDLLATGGVVAPERFQFLLWTAVGIAAFLLCVFRTDPTVISDLPGIPTRLLLLSGISSAGYLGGKLTRTPGPIIDEVLAKPGSLNLTILGHNLAPDAVIEVENESVAAYLDAEAHPDHRARGVQSDGPANLAKTLELKLARAAEAWLGKASLGVTVTNPDGQKAVWAVALDRAAQEALANMAPASPKPSPTPSTPKAV